MALRQYGIIMTSLIAASLFSLSISATLDERVYAHDHTSDFEITSFQINGKGNLRMYVEGVAGGTTPHHSGAENLIYAYVFRTNAGIYAVTSHMGEDSHQVEHDIEWHSHLVELDENNCVTSIIDAGKVNMHTNRISVMQTDATQLSGVMTAELTASDDGTCVTKIFDSLRA
jgi:hypothetical protein